jgi:hypothetical protein
MDRIPSCISIKKGLLKVENIPRLTSPMGGLLISR